MKLMFVIVLLCFAAAFAAQLNYPLYKQCDPKWGDRELGTADECNACGKKPATICREGCAMTSLSMGLAGNNVTIDDSGVVITSGTMNDWVRAHQGYYCIGGDCNNLKLTVPEKVSKKFNIQFIGEDQKPSVDILRKWVLNPGYIVIPHLYKLHHFILATGVDAKETNKFYVNDPAFDTKFYPYEDFSDIIVYTIQAADSNENVVLPVNWPRNLQECREEAYAVDHLF
eukprot:TRINITY_DN359_c0_g1_i1.p1 TRINITY_DN359_c0_g1~~TRINITY_DN359_c0_g1_i1.p1  ORF type:complete len:236 (+),score=30.50 TRINITY_DN359_c0_g1_i1:25-708(+)